MAIDGAAAAAAVRRAVSAASQGLVEREALVELVALGAVAREHLLVIGPPGTAKSEAVRRAARAFDARYFEYLLGRFTEPSEIVGPVDLRRLREGVVETETSGMLPEAEIAFLDEVFLGSTAILNTLLSLLNERTFRRGKTALSVPLRICVAASNALPEDETLAAFADRFLLRTFVDSVPDERLEDLLESGDALATRAASEPSATLADLDALAERARSADLSGARPALAQAVRLLRKAGIALSDRRVVKLQRLVAAATVLDGRDVADGRDLWPVVYALPGLDAQETGRAALSELLASARSDALGAAAEAATRGPAARAARLVAVGSELLEREPAEEAERAAWRLRVESVLREIDASFAPEARTEALEALRERAAERIAAAAAE